MNLLTVKQASEKYNIAGDTIRKYIYSGKLIAEKIGNQWLIEKAEADKIPGLFGKRKLAKREIDIKPVSKRDRKIAKLWKQGLSSQVIGDEVGLSRQRVNVIVNRFYAPRIK